MVIVKCPKCGEEVEINIAKACDEEGETFQCQKCKFIFRYAPNRQKFFIKEYYFNNR